jgi:hypothetical protein
MIYDDDDDDDCCGPIGVMRNVRGNRSTKRKPAPVTLSPPQISHDLTRVRTRAAAVDSRRLTVLKTGLEDRQISDVSDTLGMRSQTTRLRT